VVEHIDGLMSLRATLERVQIKTRQYAKRQMTWMQGQLDLTWLEVGSKETPSETAERILRQWEATPTTSDQTASPNG
jgi:tRNA A37 N6-isopentenylltransferase MiaA